MADRDKQSYLVSGLESKAESQCLPDLEMLIWKLKKISVYTQWIYIGRWSEAFILEVPEYQN